MQYNNRGLSHKPYIVYIQANPGCYITAINSSAFLPDPAGWTEIDRGLGDRYHHAQGNYLDKPLYTDSGVYRYRLEGGKIRECTPEEIAEQESAIQPDLPPSIQEQVAALQEENHLLKEQVKAITDRSDFIEDCIAEMAMQVYA